MRIGSPRARLTRPSTVGVGRGGPARGRTGFLRRGMTGGVDPPGPGDVGGTPGVDGGTRERQSAPALDALSSPSARRVFESGACYNPNYERGEVSYGPATPGISGKCCLMFCCGTAFVGPNGLSLAGITGF